MESYINDSEIKNIILENSDIREYTDIVKFKTKKSSFYLMLSKMLAQNLKPNFKNCFILKNDSKHTYEAIKICLKNLDFRFIAAEMENFSFMESLDLTLGFYLNIKSNIHNLELKNLTFEHIHPFYIDDNNKVHKLEQSKCFKFMTLCLSRIIETNIQMIFFTGDKYIEYNEELVESFRKEFNISPEIPFEQNVFTNNQTLVKNEKREIGENILKVMNDPVEDTTTLNFTMFWNFDINLEKQYQYYIDLIDKTIDVIKEEANFSIESINSPNNLSEDIVDKIIIEKERLKLDIKNVKKFRYIPVEKARTSLIDFIADKNNIDFGSDILILEKDKNLDYDICEKEINDCNDFIKKSFDNYFLQIIKPITLKKNKT